MAHGLTRIDWQAPWLAPFARRGATVAMQVDAKPGSVSAALNATGAAPVHFVPQSQLPRGQAYEAFIALENACPTRDGLHDFFNGLVWLTFPRAKRQLNRLQASEISVAGVRPTRGPLRDAATLFDENGAVLQGPQVLWQALQARDWHHLFVELRPLWQDAHLLVFGHALMEKLVQPRKGMTAHVLRGPETVLDVTLLDTWLEHALRHDHLEVKPFAPMPVLGVPGWDAGNVDPGYYADRTVFRMPLS